MKKSALTLLTFMGISFFLSGLQATLYFLPLTLPYFWVIVLSYYSFHKNFLFILTANFFHVLILVSFTTTSPALLIVLLNGVSMILYVIGQRLNITQMHMALGSALSSLVLLFLIWLFGSLTHVFEFPPLFSWIGITLMTFVFALPLLSILKAIDGRIHLDRIDTLANLRI